MIKRWVCFLLHWKRQLNEADTRYYAWRCGTCGCRWRTSRGDNGEATKIAIRNELDRTRAERDSWEAQFHSAAAAASEYSEFWERHHGDFDPAGNYIPHSQMDGDLRAAKAEIERLKSLASGEAAR